MTTHARFGVLTNRLLLVVALDCCRKEHFDWNSDISYSLVLANTLSGMSYGFFKLVLKVLLLLWSLGKRR